MSAPSDFPEPLARYVERDDGHASFSYARMTGRMDSVIERTHGALKSAMSMPARYRDKELRALLKELEADIRERAEIDRQWKEVIDARRLARDAKATGGAE